MPLTCATQKKGLEKMFKIYLRIKYMHLNVFFILPLDSAFLPLLLKKSLLEHQNYNVYDADTIMPKTF